MAKYKFLAFGSLLGIFVSFFGSIIWSIIANEWAGGATVIEFWFFYVSFVPFSITFFAISYYIYKRGCTTEKERWIISIISSFVALLLSGTIGAIFVSFLERGINRVNITGYLIWGVIYSLIFLPISSPIMYLLVNFMYKYFKINLTNLGSQKKK